MLTLSDTCTCPNFQERVFSTNNKLRQARHLSAMGGFFLLLGGWWGGGIYHKAYLIYVLVNIHTLISHVAIWPVLPYVTRYIFTYIGQYKYRVFLEFPETFKCPYEHIPCVESGHTAI